MTDILQPQSLRREQLPGWFACAFAVGVSFLHPLIFDDFFFNINRFKFGMYTASAYAGLIIFLMLCAARRHALAGQIRQPFSLSAADWGMGAFAVLAAVSTILSDDAYSSLTGDEGRLCGLVFILALAAMHVIVSRARGADAWAAGGLLISGSLCALLGILNFFKIDPFGFYQRLNQKSIDGFISTIGNVDFFSAFLCLLLPAAVAAFMRAGGWARRLSILPILLGSGAVIAARADGALIALFAAILTALCLGAVPIPSRPRANTSERPDASVPSPHSEAGASSPRLKTVPNEEADASASSPRIEAAEGAGASASSPRTEANAACPRSQAVSAEGLGESPPRREAAGAVGTDASASSPRTEANAVCPRSQAVSAEGLSASSPRREDAAAGNAASPIAGLFSRPAAWTKRAGAFLAAALSSKRIGANGEKRLHPLRESRARMCLALAGLMAGLFLVGAATQLWPDSTLSLKNHSCAKLAAHPLLFAALALLLTAAAYGLLHTRRETPAFPAPRAFLLTLLACAIVALAAAAMLFLFYTYVDTETKLTGILKLFRFRDKWGTNRGGVWVRCMKLYAESDWRVKLFGFGPDLLKKPLADAYGAEIAAYCNLSFNNAHNEYIQYLLTHGALGLAAYLLFAVGACVSLLRRARKSAAAACLLAGSLAYLLHAVVNVNQPITTPLLFLFLSASVSVPAETSPLGKKSPRRFEKADAPRENASAANVT